MSTFRWLVREVHRRSVWQVLTVYLVGSWAALQVAEGVTNSAGLPDWVPGFALVLLTLGLPVVLATAVVQEGVGAGEPRRGGSGRTGAGTGDGGATAPAPNLAQGTGSLDRPSTRPGVQHRLFTWRNAVLGGAGAFSVLGFAVAGYFAMRLTGFGPVASLSAQGVFADREPVVLADFANTTADPTLGRVVGEALRTDLLESSAVTVLPAAYIADALQRMGRSEQDGLPVGVARELAQRDGIKAVIHGEVGAVGEGYVLTASIVEAGSGSVLAAFRETAASSDQLLRGIDRLSSRIREKAGESLRTIRAGEPLSTVTTASLEALRAYTDAVQRSIHGDTEGAVKLLESAIQLDPEFAMAHRKLGAELSNAGTDPEGALAALTRAYELRHRLTSRERLLAEAHYLQRVGSDRRGAIEAYRQVLRSYPDDPAALNNLAILLNESRAEREEAVTLLQRAVDGPAATVSAHTNLVLRLWVLRRDSAAAAVVERALDRYPGSPSVALQQPNLLGSQHLWEQAHAGFEAVTERFSTSPRVQIAGRMQMAGQDAAMGRLQEARRHLAEAMMLATERELTPMYAEAATRLAWMELFTAGSLARARTVLASMDRTLPIEAQPPQPWTLANLAAAAALAQDAAMAQRAMSRMETAFPPEHRSREYEQARDFAAWALALGRDDGEAALASAEELSRAVAGSCAGQRCWGHFERALAMRAAGRPAAEIAGVLEEQVAGLPLEEVFWDAVQTPRALELLAELHEEAGNPARAAEFYGRLAEIWRDADAELQPRARRARDRAEALLATRG